MLGLVLKLRWLSPVVAFFSALHAVAFVAMGIVRGVMGYRLLLEGPPWDAEKAPGIQFAKSIDAFLLAMVFFVFSVGILELFLADRKPPALESVPEWMRVRNLSELKFLIWEAVLAALVVASVEGFVMSGHEITWAALILPVGIAILAAGLYLTRQTH